MTHPGIPPGERSHKESDKIDFGKLPVEDVPLGLIHATEEGEHAATPGMVESLRANGNINPILLGVHPTIEGAYELIDGHHRKDGLHRAGRRTARAMIVRRVVCESERHELTMQLSSLHRSVKAPERAARAERWLELNPGKTQKECALRFGCSPAALSRDLTEWSMPAEFKERTADLVIAVRQVIMNERDPERRNQAIEYALAAEDGRRPGRDSVALFVRRNREGRPKGRPPKSLKGEEESRKFEIAVAEGETVEEIVEWLRGLATKIQKFKDLPPSSLNGLFG